MNTSLGQALCFIGGVDFREYPARRRHAPHPLHMLLFTGLCCDFSEQLCWALDPSGRSGARQSRRPRRPLGCHQRVSRAHRPCDVLVRHTAAGKMFNLKWGCNHDNAFHRLVIIALSIRTMPDGAICWVRVGPRCI